MAGREQGWTDDTSFATFFLRNPLPLWIYDLETLRFLDVNDAALRNYGYGRDEFLALTIRDIRPTEDVPKVDVSVKTMPSSSLNAGIWRHRKKDGTVISVEILSQEIAFKRRRARFVCPIDITERLHAEEALRSLTQVLQERGEGLRHAQRMAKLAHVVTRADGSFESWSESLTTLIGLDEDEVPENTRDWLASIHPDDRELFRTTAIRAGITGKRTDVEYRFRHSGGSWIYIRQGIEPMGVRRDGRWFSTLQDVTDEKVAQLSIQRLNRIYAVLSGINTLIVRVRERHELYRESCRIAVEVGGLQLAWFGIVNKDLQRIDVVASHGDGKGFVEYLPLSLGELPTGEFILPAKVVMEGRAAVVDEIANDPRVMLRDQACMRGLRSVVILPIKTASEVVGVLALYSGEAAFFDATEMRLLEELAGDIGFAIGHIGRDERLQYLAVYDPLTGLHNRESFRESVAQYIQLAPRESGRAAIVLFDVERFHTINDTFGHEAGDDLLKHVAKRWRTLAEGDLVCRLGGDQFAVLVLNVRAEDEVARMIEQHNSLVFGTPFRVGDSELTVSAKFGIAVYPSDADHADSLLKNAESALYRAKTTTERYLFYTQKMTERVSARLTLENQLRRAMRRNEFVLHYQTKVDVQTRNIVGVEALMRWNNPETGLVPPKDFIPLLEETGIILEVGSWALRQAAADHRRWKRLKLPAPAIAVNVSAVQLRNRDFVQIVRDIVKRQGKLPAIGIEITESVIMDDADDTVAKLAEICRMDVQIAIDDFGTGYSSLSYLARLPVHALKIDRSFVAAMTDDPNTMTMVSTIIQLAHSLSLKVVAEGVETEEQAKILRLLKCDEMQGFLVSRPLPEPDLRNLLEREVHAV
ncbi:MAG TPA: EAL domain-containing protein [Casimicrobiaceae bacterium]|nr:EAL domain-containing protein [Casimicrobiaceae bacterium]